TNNEEGDRSATVENIASSAKQSTVESTSAIFAPSMEVSIQELPDAKALVFNFLDHILNQQVQTITASMRRRWRSSIQQ
ncbi:MAG: hypothetical protein AAFU78_07005, partial [Cyanobacteria bacterium J06633_2]